MRIVTHPVHTGYDFEFAKTGNDYFCMHGKWNEKQRPKPANWTLIGDPKEHAPYDVAVVGSYPGFDQAKDLKCPMVFNLLADASSRTMPAHIEERIDIACFLGVEAAERWKMNDDSKKRVIELGIDPVAFDGWKVEGNKWNVLTVGTLIPSRWEKGYMQLKDLHDLVPVEIVGFGNESMKGSVGELPHDKLVERYQKTRVYFNPGCVIGISVAEAMMTGMPLVTFRPINLCDLVKHGVNGFIADTVDEAADYIKLLLSDQKLASYLGANARRTALDRFHVSKFASQWNLLFYSLTGLAIPV
jgi:glycosyltransferase involved in cell wall biosynthesis